MDRVLQCDCGFEAHGADEDSLVAAVRRHALEAHGMALTHDEALLLAFRVELGTGTRPTASRTRTPRTEEEER